MGLSNRSVIIFSSYCNFYRQRQAKLPRIVVNVAGRNWVVQGNVTQPAGRHSITALESSDAGRNTRLGTTALYDDPDFGAERATAWGTPILLEV
jgi:hypothetical protein